MIPPVWFLFSVTFTHLSGPGRRKCTTPSLSDTWLRHWRSTVSTSQARMTRSAVTITSRESLIRRQAPGTPSTLPGRSFPSGMELGQAPAWDRWVSPPRSWVERPPPLEGDRSPRTTSLTRTPSSSRGDPRKPSDRPPQVRLYWGHTLNGVKPNTDSILLYFYFLIMKNTLNMSILKKIWPQIFISVLICW